MSMPPGTCRHMTPPGRPCQWCDEEAQAVAARNTAAVRAAITEASGGLSIERRDPPRVALEAVPVEHMSERARLAMTTPADVVEAWAVSKYATLEEYLDAYPIEEDER